MGLILKALSAGSRTVGHSFSCSSETGNGSVGKAAMKWGLTFAMCRGKSQMRDRILATGAGTSRPG